VDKAAVDEIAKEWHTLRQLEGRLSSNLGLANIPYFAGSRIAPELYSLLLLFAFAILEDCLGRWRMKASGVAAAVCLIA
jgi:hypothetical protein